MEFEVSTVVDRPVDVVWDFFVVHQEENHPRWDPDLELEKLTDGPVRVGTVFRRRNNRPDPPSEGTIEVVELELNKLMRVKTRDGSTTINGFVGFEETGTDQTRLTLGAEFPGVDDSMVDTFRPMVERSAATIKELIEAET